ncbi:MAG: sugar MFS transporter [Pseudomonadota bacterium]
MATTTGSIAASPSLANSQINYSVPLALMISLFFMIGFITVLNDVLIPSLKGLFALNRWQAMLVQFCFFIAYGVMSIPAGQLIQRIGYKKGLAVALATMATGLFLFVPASAIVSYEFFLFALFVVATGLTILQVAINPYIIALGPEATGAARLNMGGTANSTATFLGPIIGAAYILPHGISDPLEKAAAVKGPYLVLALVTVAIAVLLYFLKLPRLATEVDRSETLQGHAWQFQHLRWGAGAIFVYVGAEVAIGSVLILYFVEDHLIRLGSDAIASLSPEKAASSLVAYYWGSAMIGRFVGSIIGQKIAAEVMLRWAAAIALLLVALALSGVFLSTWLEMKVMVLNLDPFSISFEPISFPLSLFLLVLVGLFNSVMWPCIFPLALKNLGKHTSQGSGILVSMVAGGALIPLLQGYLAGLDGIGFQYSFAVVVACYLYILAFALRGYKPQ